MNSLGKNFVFTSFRESHGKAIGGVLDGVTLGTPIAFIIRNKDARSEDYEWLKHTYRVGHADRTYQEKYGIRIGRHDACIAVWAAAVVEAMAALVLQDFLSK